MKILKKDVEAAMRIVAGMGPVPAGVEVERGHEGSLTVHIPRKHPGSGSRGYMVCIDYNAPEGDPDRLPRFTIAGGRAYFATREWLEAEFPVWYHSKGAGDFDWAILDNEEAPVNAIAWAMAWARSKDTPN